MNHRIRSCRPILRAAVIVTAIVALGARVSSGVVAQTITGPNAKTKLASPPVTAKSIPSATARTCSGYRAGFVYVPGSQTCIKIGGYIEMDGADRRRCDPVMGAENYFLARDL
jgi:hypothetical protein